jgi:hypothetical protein
MPRGTDERDEGFTEADRRAIADIRRELDAELGPLDATPLDATKRGDIARQMRFYPARVPVSYTWRDVPRSAVHEEKQRVFGAATLLQVATGAPTVELADEGRSAVTRRRGEVVQELRWTRTADGWRIVAERDAQVLSP